MTTSRRQRLLSISGSHSKESLNFCSTIGLILPPVVSRFPNSAFASIGSKWRTSSPCVAASSPAIPSERPRPTASPPPRRPTLTRWRPPVGRRVLALAGPRYAAHVLAPAACPPPLPVAPLAPQTARGAGALATPLPAITRGLPGAPHTAPPTPLSWFVPPQAWGNSRFRLTPACPPGSDAPAQPTRMTAVVRPRTTATVAPLHVPSRCCFPTTTVGTCQRCALALDVRQRRVPASWRPAARSRPRCGGVRCCRSVDVRSRHCACRPGTLAPGGAGVGWRAAWWQRAPTPLVGRCAPLAFDGSFTGRAVCCRGPLRGQFSREDTRIPA